MNAGLISQMCDELPLPEDDVVQDNYQQLPDMRNSLGVDDPQQARFIRAYSNLQFGWQYARTMALNGRPIRVILQKRDTIIWKAYLYIRDPKRYRDAELLEALAFTDPSMHKDRAVLHGLLMAAGASIDSVAATLNKKPAVIAAYETLFFNVLDRRSDHLFISKIVYPEGRLVEFYDRYVDSEAIDRLLLRAGYNNGAMDLLYIAGFPSDALLHCEGKDTPARLESMIMALGLMLARNGWISQGPGSCVGMHQAKQLLNSAKAAGVDAQESPFYDKNPGQVVLADLHRHRSETLKRRRAFMSPESNAALFEVN